MGKGKGSVDRMLLYVKKGQIILEIKQENDGQVSPQLAFLLGKSFSVNTATAEDLQLINGIGPSLAGKIITYRTSHGPIKSPLQLQKIHGIGPKTAKRLTKYLTFTVEGE